MKKTYCHPSALSARNGAIALWAASLIFLPRGPVHAETSDALNRGEVWIWGGEAVVNTMAETLGAAGISTVRAGLEHFTTEPDSFPAALLLVPGKALPPHARPWIDNHRRHGGALAVFDPQSMDYRRSLTKPVPVVDFRVEGSHSLRRPASSAVNPEPVVETMLVEAPGSEGSGLRVRTKLIGDGDVLVRIPMGEERCSRRDMIGFRAKGSHDTRILTLGLDDDAGRSWTAFVELALEWETFEVPMADFLPAGEEGRDAGQVDPGRIRTLSMGMVSRVLWPEVSGEFSVADVVLGESGEQSGTRTADVGAWRVQYEALGIAVPPWYWDPFAGTEKLGRGLNLRFPGADAQAGGSLAAAGEVWTVPPPPHERGRERTELEEILMRDERFSRDLFVTGEGGAEKKVARWEYFHGTDYAGSQLFRMGLPGEDYAFRTSFGSALAAVINYMVNRPKIVRVTPVLTDWSEPEPGLVVRVMVENPTDRMLEGKMVLDLAGGMASGEAPLEAGAGTTAVAEVRVSSIPPDFPLARFRWRAVLMEMDEAIDAVEDEVDAESLLRDVADYALHLQANHKDGRYSHHFFADHYAARFLLPYSRRVAERGEASKAVAMKESALRFADMIASRQREDGSFPMGYGEHRDIIFVADLGQICLGLVHLASHLEETDPRRASYLDTVRRYLPFRQSFRQSPERVSRLEAEFGPDPTRIREGFYGIGLLGSDYFDGGRWDDIRPEYRGRWWVLPVSMGFLGALARLEEDETAHALGREDLRIYLEGGFEITTAAYFHAESLFWMYYGIEDEGLRKMIRRKLADELPPKLFRDKEGIPLELQGRASLWWLSLLYHHRYFEEREEFRAAFVQGLWSLGSQSSSHSVAQVMHKYPQTVYGPSIGAFRYATFSAFWLLELLEEGSTLLRGMPFPKPD